MMPIALKPYASFQNLSFALVLLLVVVYNMLIPYPAEPYDFSRLGMNCLLIEQQGLKYAINDNWGFALPALSYGLTQITGDLLPAQRIVSGIFAVAAWWLILNIFTRRLGGVFDSVAFAGALLLLFHFTFFIVIISCHWDIVPITAVLFGIWRLQNLNVRNAFWVGLAVAAGYWFRFHFLGFALLYPLLVFLVKPHKSRKLLLAVTLGCFAGIALPHILTWYAFGQLSMSNQTAVIAEMVEGVVYECDNERQRNRMSIGSFLAKADWRDIFHSFYSQVTFYVEIVLFELVFISFTYARLRRKSAGLFSFKDEKSRQIIVSTLYIAVCSIPFIFLRGMTGRLLAAFFIPAFPFFWWLLYRHGRLMAGIALGMILLIPFRMSSHFSYYYNNSRQCREDIAFVLQHIPEQALREEPSRVLNLDYAFFPNPFHRYRISAAVISYGIHCRYEPFFEFFHQVRLEDLGDTSIAQRYDYILTPAPSVEDVYWKFQTLQDHISCPFAAHNGHIALFRCNVKK